MHLPANALRLFLLSSSALSGLWPSTPVHCQVVSGYPQDIGAYDVREVAMLPRYCIYTQYFRDKVPGGSDQATIDGWYAQLGTAFHAMHHYCWGIMKTNRAVLLTSDRVTRQFYLSDSIGEFDYVIEHVPPDFVLLPEILAKKGENLIRLGRGSAAIAELQKATELKPDYWPPYAHMSDYFKEVGDKARAREVLQAGLRSAPDAAALQNRLAQLDVPTAKKKSTP